MTDIITKTCVFFPLILCFQLKYCFDRFFKIPRNFKCQNGRRHILFLFYSVNGLPAHPDNTGKFFLGDILNGSFYFECAYHI